MKWQRPVAVASNLLVEAGLPLAVAAGFMVGSALLASARRLDTLGYLILAAGAASLLVRARWPRAALAGTIAAAFAYDLLSYPAGLCTLAVGVAVYAVADSGHRRAGVLAVAGVVGGFLAIGAVLGRGHVDDAVTALWFAGWLVASLGLGETMRSRRLYLEEVERRALAAERSREEVAARRATEERIRIAQELHDILAHRISMISVQSGVGAHLLDRQPEQARAALVAINEASREALQELRATLGVLRQADGLESRAPVPGLAQLDAVIANTTAAGVNTLLEVRGEQRPLPAGVDLAAYRIVQEALTNVVRHARATTAHAATAHAVTAHAATAHAATAHAVTAHVVIDYGHSDLSLDIRDDGIGSGDGAAANGNGLLGMRERATALGGELTAGPGRDGGFRVRASLPFDRTSAKAPMRPTDPIGPDVALPTSSPA